MSRFSKKEAQARGWRFVHDEPAHDVIESSTQGRSRHVPRNIRAEKDTGPGLGIVNAQGESEGLVLEQIAFIEAQLEGAVAPQATVIVAGEEGPEAISEAEYQERLKERDGNAVTFEVGAEIDSAALAAEAENARVAGSAGDPEIATEQHSLDPIGQPLIDAPGATGTGLIVTREGESPSDAALRSEAEKAEAEDAKSLEPSRAPEDGELPGQSLAVAPEEEDEEPFEPDATPEAAALAAENDLDLSEIDGSGEDGRILVGDVEAYLDAEAAEGDED